ncbi:MAG: M56 family metallopeptidase [Bacteroidales bacterium]|nr:M56 family metallopeptidase [Bacteroidales bacterium]MBD5235262.1 M56 family metallopeptidase [Barnesiella sp.]
MGAFLSYSIISGLLLGAMYAMYRLTMASDNQPGYNRWVLMSIYVLSFAALPVAWLVKPLLQSTAAVAETAVAGDDAVISQIVNQAQEVAAGTPLWSKALLWIFMAGMAVMLLRTVLTWARIRRVIAAGEKRNCGGYTLVLTDDNSVAPFSWHRYMVMNRDDFAVAGNAITLHEARHIGCRHWIDLLVAQAVVIINWFNPAAWLMRDELMLVHEYQADNAVIDNDINPKEYQMLLIKKAVGAKFPSLANSLNHSKLKKRITMMYKSKSGAKSRLKVLALAPAALAAVLLTGITPVKAAISTIESSVAIDGKVSNNNADGEISAANFTRKIVNNHDGKTNVVLSLTVPGNTLSVSDARLKVASGTYTSNGMSTEMRDNVARIEATFQPVPNSDFNANSSITVTFNGSEVTLPLSQADIALSNDNANVAPEVYIDDKKATQAEMAALMPEDIADMVVDKSNGNNTIQITLRK